MWSWPEPRREAAGRSSCPANRREFSGVSSNEASAASFILELIAQQKTRHGHCVGVVSGSPESALVGAAQTVARLAAGRREPHAEQLSGRATLADFVRGLPVEQMHVFAADPVGDRLVVTRNPLLGTAVAADQQQLQGQR
jgi:hypothetical protein